MSEGRAASLNRIEAALNEALEVSDEINESLLAALVCDALSIVQMTIKREAGI